MELIQITRGSYDNADAVEVVHRGSVAVVSGDTEVLHALGDVRHSAHLRSTAKPFQLLPLLKRKINKKAGLDDGDLALLMSSHSGESEHIARLRVVMQKLQVDETELLCGVHEPMSGAARRALLLASNKAGVLHNNCSAKHCAMVATARSIGPEGASYIDASHPLQREIASLLLEISGASPKEIGFGIDGCSAPTFIMPLFRIATLYAKLAQSGSSNYGDELKLLFSAGTSNPFMVAGTKRLDTVLMQVARGTVFAKTGAEGVYAMAVRPCDKYKSGLGLAIKVDDGDNTNRARELIALSLLIKLGVLSESELRSNSLLSEILDGKIKNYRGIETGHMRSVFTL